MKRTLAIVAGLLAFVAAFLLMIYCLRPEAPTDIDQSLAEFIRKTNARLPMMADRETRWDKLELTATHTLTYNCTLINVEFRQVDPYRLRESLQPVVKSRTTSSSDMRPFLAHGVTITYVYYDRNGRFIMKFDVTPYDAGY